MLTQSVAAESSVSVVFSVSATEKSAGGVITVAEAAAESPSDNAGFAVFALSVFGSAGAGSVPLPNMPLSLWRFFSGPVFLYSHCFEWDIAGLQTFLLSH